MNVVQSMVEGNPRGESGESGGRAPIPVERSSRLLALTVLCWVIRERGKWEEDVPVVVGG